MVSVESLSRLFACTYTAFGCLKFSITQEREFAKTCFFVSSGISPHTSCFQFSTSFTLSAIYHFGLLCLFCIHFPTANCFCFVERLLEQSSKGVLVKAAKQSKAAKETSWLFSLRVLLFSSGGYASSYRQFSERGKCAERFSKLVGQTSRGLNSTVLHTRMAG